MAKYWQVDVWKSSWGSNAEGTTKISFVYLAALLRIRANTNYYWCLLGFSPHLVLAFTTFIQLAVWVKLYNFNFTLMESDQSSYTVIEVWCSIYDFRLLVASSSGPKKRVGNLFMCFSMMIFVLLYRWKPFEKIESFIKDFLQKWNGNPRPWHPGSEKWRFLFAL